MPPPIFPSKVCKLTTNPDPQPHNSLHNHLPPAPSLPQTWYPTNPLSALHPRRTLRPDRLIPSTSDPTSLRITPSQPPNLHPRRPRLPMAALHNRRPRLPRPTSLQHPPLPPNPLRPPLAPLHRPDPREPLHPARILKTHRPQPSPLPIRRQPQTFHHPSCKPSNRTTTANIPQEALHHIRIHPPPTPHPPPPNRLPRFPHPPETRHPTLLQILHQTQTPRRRRDTRAPDPQQKNPRRKHQPQDLADPNARGASIPPGANAGHLFRVVP